MSKQGKYPKPIEDFFQNGERYKKISPLKIRIMGKPNHYYPITFEYYMISPDELDIEEYPGDPEEDLAELFYTGYSDEMQEHFRANFVPLISETLPDQCGPTVLGVYLDEEKENFPVYIIGEDTDYEKEKVANSLDSFVALYFANGSDEVSSNNYTIPVINNTSIDALNSKEDCLAFIDAKFDKPVTNTEFSPQYLARRAPDALLDRLDQKDASNIRKRERMQDKVFVEYGVDFFEQPFLVFFESDSEELKPFKIIEEAEKFCEDLLQRGIYSLLITIMSNEIEFKLYK
ncbi:hypothetical protein J0X14_01535 [Muricauda sp. CAU 1633]|uniref:hypothetical protein n=1 Tax=Allomuricauda sp. CAU 1633 TaxID=2816036 RepID=UPI001A8DA50C|nr:hypothetical protein [Muricauda sp. CAU 1633]MBO0320961.1 hypothetical protein [Muricauda sp. CAU 1633]